jgi:phasin family protein
MSDNTENPANKAADTMHAATQRGMQTAQDMGRRATEAGLASMGEFTRMFSEMKFPAMPDMDSFLQAHRRNMETLSAANRVALEGAQSVAKRHMEIVQQTMQEMTEAIRELSSPDSPQTRAAKQADMIKHAYERAVAHLKELADLIQRANGEALEMLNHRFREAMDEVKALAEKSGQKQG